MPMTLNDTDLVLFRKCPFDQQFGSAPKDIEERAARVNELWRGGYLKLTAQSKYWGRVQLRNPARAALGLPPLDEAADTGGPS